MYLYSENCISDSFTFAIFTQNLELNPTKTFMCSVDVSSWFTDLPLDETIKICADALYRSEVERPSFPEEIFIELMKSATISMEFNFNSEMYRQKDDVAVYSSLGPALANIFIGFHDPSTAITFRSFRKGVCMLYFCCQTQLIASVSKIHL